MGYAVLCFFIGVMGACLGSFLNAVAMRTVAEKKWWGSERSHCDECNAVLVFGDLIPILSYCFLKGRCRYCGKKIKPRHLTVELLMSAGSMALFYWWGLSSAFLLSIVCLFFLLFNSLTDLDTGYIYDLWAVALGVIGILLRISGGWPAVMDGLLGAALGFGVILLIIVLSRGGMGWGDATLMLGAGGALGWARCAMGMYMGFMVGGLVILPLLALKKVSRKDAIPLGPFLAVGCLLAIFGGNAVSDYFGLEIVWPWGSLPWLSHAAFFN